ncbi:MAG: DUF4445 domain-containing protein, partial [Lachnospiraceae bacterium]|nr:DUF4445 domain-containing protein [Candidatus Equihabitans merdae]
IAVDIATTTVAAVLLDLTNGETLSKTSAVNPQTAVGGDVLSRIVYTQDHEDGLPYCQKLIVDELNNMTKTMVEKTGISYEDIRGYTVAANCTMLHLLLGVDPISLGRAPFTPVFREGQMKKAVDIGLCPQNPSAGLYCLPSVSAYIGADIVAGIHMARLAKTDKNVMFIDIGTNGEIVLTKGGKMYACSCAAGPAMEGMNISCGCRAAEGAIEGVSFEEGQLKIKVIGDAEPKGICGSGVLETVAAFLKCGAVRPDGRLMTKKSQIPDLLYEEGREKGYYLSRENNVYFSQADVRQIQLAKGAILSGFRALINTSELSFDELDEVMIAGQFGSHLKAETMVDIGILPAETRDKVSYIGNTSLSGAISVFLDKSLVDVYEEISESVQYMELGTLKGYNEIFISCLTFPKPEA